jgi:hypothetical protein
MTEINRAAYDFGLTLTAPANILCFLATANENKCSIRTPVRHLAAVVNEIASK